MKYEIEIVDKPYRKEYWHSESQTQIIVEAQKTAIVTFIDDGSKNKAEIYGYKSSDDIKTDFRDSDSIIISYCVIDSAIFQNQEFESIFAEKTLFNCNVEFRNCISHAYSDFSDAVFGGEVEFAHMIFKSKVQFTKAIFNGVLSIDSNSGFDDIVGFQSIIFNRDVRIEGAVFGKEVEFNGSIFRKKCQLRLTTFKKKLEFWLAIFKDDANFQNIVIDDAIIFYENTFSSHLNLKFVRCEKLLFDECTIEKSCSIFNGTDFKYISMNNPKCYGQFSFSLIGDTIAAIYAVNEYNTLIDYIKIANTFNFLKVNFNHNGDYEEEDQAYVEYRRCLRETKKPLVHFFDWLLLDKISCYCTKPSKVFRVAIITIIAFALLFYLSTILPCIPDAITFAPNTVITVADSATTVPEILVETTNNYEGIGGCFYHSLITFFTIGYGDSRPLGILGLILTGLEGFIGVFLMSLFTVSFVRKALR